MSIDTLFPAHTTQTAPAESRPAMITTEAEFGSVPPAVARLATSPELLNGFLAASAAFEQTTLPAVAREVVIMTVAVRNGCRVCIGLHGAKLRQLGRLDVLQALRDRFPIPDPALEAVRTFTERLLDEAGEVPEDRIREFLDAGYTNQNALEIVYGIGAYTMSTFANRLVRA